jgi:uncharacterized protein
MKIQNEFTVSAPIEEAWNVMLDLERIAPCLPGAAIQDSDDGEYQGTMKVKIGPITANYKGTVKFEETDEAAHRAVLQATGRDARGQGTASATIISTLEEVSDGTKVNVETDMKLTGRAAQFGRGIAQDVASKMLNQFASCLENEISGGGAAAASAETPTAKEPETASSNGASGDAPAVTPTVTGSLGNVVSSEDPTVTAGASVQGAVVSGSSPESAPPPAAARPEPEPFDIGAAGSEAVLKRAAPVLAGVGILLILLWLLRRRR